MTITPFPSDFTYKESLLALQDEALPAVLERARKAPFYRDSLPISANARETWSRLPLTTKEDLRRAYPIGMLAVPLSELATYHESSGTTGEPTPSYLTDADWHDIASRFARSAIDMKKGEVVLVNTPYSMMTTAHQMHQAARLKGAVVVPASNRSWNIPYARVMRLLRDLPITLVWCVPTNALLTAAAARAAGRNPKTDFPSLRAFLVAGEAMSEGRRTRLQTLWGGKAVFQDYGSTETGSLAGECSERRMHLWADRVLFEVIDPKTGEARREGVGQLVVTPLYREAMPLVRYSLEDTVEICYDTCPCGWSLPTVRVLGRSATRVTVQGREFFPVELEDAVYSLPEVHEVFFWRARHDATTLEVEIEADREHRHQAGRALQELIYHRLGISAQVRSLDPGAIVPQDVLTENRGSSKPRYLFAKHEEWQSRW